MSRKKESGKEADEKLLAILKEWQKVEEKSISSIAEITQRINNPLVKQVLQIIQHDSSMHRKVQQFIVDTMETRAVSLEPAELGEIWSAIETHIDLEREAVALGQRAKETASSFVHRYLLNYLLTDERKHDELLEQLENIKRKIYPYA